MPFRLTLRKKILAGYGLALVLLIAGLVLGTAALATLFPDVPYGVEVVMWGATLPAPMLMTYWIYRQMPTGGDERPEYEEQSDS